MEDALLYDIDKAEEVVRRSLLGETHHIDDLLQIRTLCYVYDTYAMDLANKFGMSVKDFSWLIDQVLETTPH